MKPRHEVADIFHLYGDESRKTHKMTDEQCKVMAALEICRTARLGDHMEIITKSSSRF